MALARREAPAVRTAPKDGASTSKGTGSGSYKVKGKRATARQRRMIDGTLSRADKDGASRRVMIAAIMCITQESVCGEAMGMTGNDDVGLYQQGRNWVSATDAKDPDPSTHAFLITGPTAWKKVHGGVKKAPGNLSHAIHAVQGNRDPNAYAAWENEATATVGTWLADGGSDGGSYIRRYTFTRGERHGQREDSWDASGRLVEEVGAFRWAAGNTFYAVSGDELRQQAPALTIEGDEGWLLTEPAWSWSSRRTISELTLNALSDRWDVMPGGLVVLGPKLGAMAGRWNVWNVSGESLDSPVTSIILRRPAKLRKEPASEVAQYGSDGAPGTVERLKAVCREVSRNRTSYVYGGGHGIPVRKLKTTTHFDCSSAVSYALYRAGFFDGDKIANTSSVFASSWGHPGKGDEFTVYANASHAFIEFDDGSRFDTSQHVDPSGAAYTTKKRKDQSRFTPRHYKGH